MSRIAVLMGGWSAERAVSLSSGRGVAAALRDLGHEVVEVDAPRDPHLLLAALDPRPDLVFNALHGRGGEDGHIQALLDLIDLPYTHSGMRASALAMDKPAARDLFEGAGLPIAAGQVVDREQALSVLPPPFVVKPTDEGSSVGVHIVRVGGNDLPLVADLPDRVLVEEFIPGRELTVAVMGERALPVVEIVPAAGWYDYDAKYRPGGSRHLCPAPVSGAIAAEAMRIAVTAHRALGCRGISRADLRYDDRPGVANPLILLEINTQPGMTPTSLVPDAARAAGLSYHDLVAWMVREASCDR